jgi:hypothetical protein
MWHEALSPPRRQEISYALEQHALAARRFFAEQTLPHRRELELQREEVRTALAKGERPTRQDVSLARQAAAKERARDRERRLCHCGRCAARRKALRMYTLGFRDGALGRLGKRRIDDDLRPYRKHFKAGLADGRRALAEHLRELEERLSKTL